jgi:hypothetical protein
MLVAMLVVAADANARLLRSRSRWMETRRTQLYLEIDCDSEPVTGLIGRPGGELTQFTGYASLIAAIHALRSGEPDPPRVVVTKGPGR